MNDLAILLCGPAGCGKSTYAADLMSTRPGFKIISPDDLRAEVCGDAACQDKNHLIFSTLIPIRIVGARVQTKNLLFDATNTTRKARHQAIGHIKAAGYKRIECHVIKVPIEEAKRRNAARTRVVPDFVIDRQFAQWQEPALDEGFDEIVYVNAIPLDNGPQSE